MTRKLFLLALFTVLVPSLVATAHEVRDIRGLFPWNGLSMDSLVHLANTFDRQGKKDSTILCYEIMASRYDLGKLSKIETRQAVSAMHNLGYIYMHYFYDYRKANQYLTRALTIAEEQQLETDLPFIYLSMAIINSENSNIHNDYTFSTSVLEQFQKAYYAALHVKQWSPLVTNIINMSVMVLMNQGQNNVKHIEKELENFQSLDIPSDVPSLAFARLLTQGVRAYGQKDYEQALALFRELPATKAGVGMKNHERDEIIAHQMIGCALMKLNRDQEAQREQETIERLSRQYKVYEGVLEAYLALYSHYNLKGNVAMSSKYRLLYLEQKDSFINKRGLSNADEIQFLLELQKVKKQMLDETEKRKVQERNMWIAIGITLFIFIILALLVANHVQIRRKNHKLYQRNRELLDAERQRLELLRLQTQADAQPGKEKAKYESSPMDTSERSDLLHRILIVMETNEEIYSDTFSIARLTELVDARHSNYVSHAINERYHKNFHALLNEYRIKEACRRMHNTQAYGNYTIEAIAQSVGFKSRPNFVKTFKDMTGLTPSAYLKLSRNQEI